MSSIDKLIGQMAASGALDKATKASAARQRKADAKATAKAAREAQSAAVAADNWLDRPDKARPTPERKAKGVFVLRDGDDAGVTVAVDEAVTLLDTLCADRRISADQCQAGLDFADLMVRTRLLGQGRSCLDFSPVGHHGDNDTGNPHDHRARALIYSRCKGPWVWPELVRVCSDGRPVSHLPSLIAGLDVCLAVLSRGS